MLKRLCIAAALVCFTAGSSAPAEEEKRMTVEEFEASLQYKTGEVVLPGGMATLRIPPSFRYLGPDDAERVLVQAWGNPPGAGRGSLGMLFSAAVSPVSPEGWGVVITYADDGYVSDSDAGSIDYDDLLGDMKKAIAEENAERRKNGHHSIELVGWAAKPFYDKDSHKLHWAKELSFDGEQEHTLNYNIRVLGRKGVLVLNAVASVNQLGTVEQEMQQVLAFTEFNPGYRYAEYDSRTDKTAAYGIAALVAGGVAAKAGLFTKLLGLLLAAKKLVIAGVAAAGAFLANLFRKKKGAGAPE